MGAEVNLKPIGRFGLVSALLVLSLINGAAGYTSPFENLPAWATASPYHVSGGTRQELRKAIREAMAGLWDDEADRDFGAAVISSYSYEIERGPATPSRSGSGSWTCTATGWVDVSLSLVIRYPVWDDLVACPDSALVGEWRQYMAALYDHEVGHLYIARTGLRRLNRELAGLEMTAAAGSGIAACDLARRLYRDLIRKDFERITAGISQAQEEYDSRTDYGRKRNAAF
jgi:hypothetical protein